MQFNIARLKELVLFVANSCDAEDVGSVKLHKVAYFADMISFAQFKASITGATYRKRPFGPMCDELSLAIKQLEDQGDIEVRETDFYGYRKREFHPKRRADLSFLNSDQIGLLEEVTAFVCLQNSARTISDFSHNRVWEAAKFGETLPYATAFLIYPSEVSQEAFDWAEAESRRGEYSKQDPETVGSVTYYDFRSRASA